MAARLPDIQKGHTGYKKTVCPISYYICSMSSLCALFLFCLFPFLSVFIPSC